MTAARPAPLRIVCFFAVVFCGGTRAAPTVAYDQRQNGEFNLRVDLEDVAVVLLAGGDGAAELFPLRRDSRPGEKEQNNMHVLQLLQLAERRNGAVASPKKKNKKPVDCAAAAGAEKPYVEAAAVVRPQSPAITTSPAVPTVPVDYETPQGSSSADHDKSPPPAPVFESRIPVVAANTGPPPRSGPDEYLIDDPYSVTPSTPDISERNSLLPSADSMVAVKTVENHPAPVRVPEFPENAVAVKTAVVVPSPTPVSTRFEEKPISVSSDAKTVGEKSDETVTMPRDETEAKAKIPADGAPPPTLATTRQPTTADGAAIVTKIVQETSNDFSAGTAGQPVSDENHAAPSAVSLQKVEKKPELPVELVAVKTVEKPTFAEALKADGKSSTAVESAAIVGDGENTTVNAMTKKPEEKLIASAAPVDVLVRTDEKTIAAESVIVKTAEAPIKMTQKPDDASAAVVSGTTSGTRPVELPKDKSAATAESTVVVSRLAAKPTAEMVAVKTIENGASSVTTGNISVKTAVKSGNAKTTLLTNGSSIVRKVADRRPLPSATFEVAAPNVARA